MIIGIDCNALTRGAATGVERYVRALITEMMTTPLEPGEQVRLYVSAIPSVGTFLLPPGFSWRVLSFPFPKGWTHLRLSWELRRHRPDVLFVPAHEVPMFVSKKTKVVTTIHDVAFRRVPHVYEARALRRQAWAVRRAVRKATRLIAVSQTTANDLIELYHVAPERICVTPLAVRADTFVVSDDARQRVLQQYRLTAGQYVFYIGRLESKKNVVTLIQAFAALKQELGVGHPLRLVLAGSFGYGAENVKRAINQASNDIRLLNFVPDADIAALMGGALTLCFPSHYEGFGLPILEGFAAKVPVVVSDIPSSREVAGEAALYVIPTDVAGWVGAIKKCLFDHALRTSLVVKGSERLQQFSWTTTARETWRALREV